MSTSNEVAVMRLALEALQFMDSNYISLPQQGMQAIKALEEELAKQEQSVSVGEPVAWMSEDECIVYTSKQVDGYFQHDHIPLYTTPYVPTGRQQRTTAEGEDTRRAWVGFTYDERVSIVREDENRSLLEHCERIEAELKEKNTRNGGCL